MKNNFINSGLGETQIRRLVLSRLEHIGCVRSLTCYLLLKYNEDEQYVNLGIDPLHYTEPSSFSSAYEATELLRKCNFLNLSWSPRERAEAAFHDCEELCRITNRRLLTDHPTGRVNDILSLARKMISSLLPVVDADLIQQVMDESGFGPGVSSSCKGSWVSPINKFASKMQHTPALTGLVDSFKRDIPFGDCLQFEEVIGSRVSYVPKDARSDRPICIEPQLNGYLQKGVGAILRRLLRSWGCDLRDQTKNQSLARVGSVSGHLATIDLKSASDTISYEVVRYLLPSDWFTLLAALRSSRYTSDGKVWKRFHKFSSMGNGFTFELESMIFLALVKACRAVNRNTDDYSVYGDDIIIATSLVEDFGKSLSFLGFQLNSEKSFTSGPFRESCGADFFLGCEVRPFYIKACSIVTAYNWANWLLQSSRRLINSRKTWQFIFNKTPGPYRFRVPRESGLLGFEVDGYDAWISGTPYYRPPGWVFIPSKRPVKDVPPSVIASIYSGRKARVPTYPYENLSSSGLEDVGRGIGRWVVRRAKVNSWPDSPWV